MDEAEKNHPHCVHVPNYWNVSENDKIIIVLTTKFGTICYAKLVAKRQDIGPESNAWD